jgi:hypothetical protein
MLEGNYSPSENSESRALVCVEPELVAPHPHRVTHYESNFLTHLIAMAEQVPQMRERRRAEPAEAAAAYQSSLERFSAQ